MSVFWMGNRVKSGYTEFFSQSLLFYASIQDININTKVMVFIIHIYIFTFFSIHISST